MSLKKPQTLRIFCPVHSQPGNCYCYYLFGKCRTEEMFLFLFVHVGQHRDILAAVTSAICMGQHSSFPLLMAPEGPKVRILWAVALIWVRHSGSVPGWFSTFMWEFGPALCLFLSPPTLVALSVWTKYSGHGSDTGVFEQCKKTPRSFFIVCFLLPCQRILVRLQAGRVQGTHLIQTTGNFYSPVSSVAEGAHCSLASLPLWRKGERATRLLMYFC